MDPLHELFQAEAHQHIDALEGVLLELENDLSDDGFDAACRHLHTLKGLCRLNGMEDAARHIHQIEDGLVQTRSPSTCSALLDWLPALKQAVDDWCQTGTAQLPELPDTLAGPGKAPADPAQPLPDISAELQALMTEPQKQALCNKLNKPDIQLWELIYAGPADALEEVLDHLEPLGDIHEQLIHYTFEPPRLEVLLLTHADSGPENAEIPENVKVLSVRNWPGGTGTAPLDADDTQRPEEAPTPNAPIDTAASAKAEALQARLHALKLSFARDKAQELEETSNQIIALGQASDREMLDEVFRQFHSLKGAGGTHGLNDVTTLSHAAESLLEKIREKDNPLSEAQVDVLLQATDVLRALLQAAAKETPAPAVPDSLLAALKSAAGSSVENEAPPPPAPAQPARPASTPDPTPHPPQADKAPLRIPLSRVDTLINLCGEISLTRHGQARTLGLWRRATRELDRACQLWRRLDSGDHLNESERHTLTQKIGAILHHTREQMSTLIHGFEIDLDQGMQYTDQLISESLSLRSISVDQLFSQLPRLVRDTARQTGKNVRLISEANDAEIDKHVLERLREPLIHMVRNAIDHGIEPPEERVRCGKPDQATLRISAHSQGSRIELRIEDDGCGLDPEKLRQRAREKGLIDAETAHTLSDAEARQLIFLPGFSTRDQASEVSGRGVGMDVVRHTVDSLGGQIHIDSAPGQGTTFRLILPVNLSITPVITLRLGTFTCAVLKDRVDRLHKPGEDMLGRLNDRPALIRDDILIPLYPLGSLLGLPDAGATPFVLELSTPEGPVGLQAEAIDSEEWVMIRPFRGLVEALPGYAGGFIDARGCVIPVLDLNALLKHTASASIRRLAESSELCPTQATILVAEDSLMTRQLYESVLRGAGFQVVGAEDGLQAWEKLREHDVDLVVSDIRMPEMNGLELTRLIRRDSRLKHLPVILVTGQESEEERQAGLDAGADAYIFKSRFLQTELLDRIRLLTGVQAT